MKTGEARLGWAALLTALVALAGCEDENVYQPPPPPAVTVATPLQQPVTAYLELTGSTSATMSVDLVARVEGYLQSVEFTDGTVVKKDTPLFVIEPAPYQAKVAQQRAVVEQQQATLVQAEAEYQRQQNLIKDKATSQANVEQARAARDSAQGAVDEAQANLQLAEIDLSYTQVNAPFDGRIGRHLVDPGNLVGHGEPTTLANIEQLDPLYVYFTLNEIDVLRVREVMRARGMTQAPVGTLPILVGLQTEQGYPHQGTLDFVSTSLETSTGVLQLRALLPNADYVFLPGLFVRVRVPLGDPEPGLFVPNAIVGYDQGGHYVLVVGADDVVAVKRVTIGVKEQNLRQIVEGLEATDRVVIEGVQKAVPGSKVAPSDGQMAAASDTKQN